MATCDCCGRKLYPNEGDWCRLCLRNYEAEAAAHDAMYGREEREMALAREEHRQDGVEGFWDGDGWHWYDED